MLHVDVTLEDTRLIASRVGKEWFIKLVDGPTGEEAERRWNDSQIGAVLALAMGVGEDEHLNDPVFVAKLYQIAETAVESLPQTLRPIP